MQLMATVIWKKKQRFVSQKGKCKAFQERVRSEVWINGSHANADLTCIQARYRVSDTLRQKLN